MTQKIGLEAVLEMGQFDKSTKEYNNALSSMTKNTEKVSAKTIAMGNIMADLAARGLDVVAAALPALVNNVRDWIDAASEAQAIEAQLDQVLLSTGGAAGMSKDAILDLANSLSLVTPYEDDLIVSTETLLLQFKNIGQDVFPQATEMALDLATRLGIDTASAAKLLGKALESPGEGLARLRQAGVAFTDEQEAMITKMVESGDAAGAQKYIMDQLATSVGGAATAAGETFTGKLEILKNQFGNVKEQIGTALLPALQSIADKLLAVLADPTVQAAIQSFADWLAVNLPLAIDAVVGFIEDPLIPTVKSIAKWISGTLIPAISTLYEWLKTNIPKAADAVTQALGWVKDNILTPVAKAFEAISEAVQWVIDKIKEVIAWFEKVGDSLPDWLVPGSPTPFELGIRGISKALEELGRLPVVNIGAPAMAGAGAGSVSNYSYGGDTYNMTINDSGAWALAQRWADNRRQARLNRGM